MILYINRSDSRCGNCGYGADPNETGHFTTMGYGDERPRACQGIWTGISSDYANYPEMMASTEEGYIFYENLRGLPIYTFFDEEAIGYYGGGQ
jgi:hypothetical protein